jgi:hypothetical protein
MGHKQVVKKRSPTLKVEKLKSLIKEKKRLVREEEIDRRVILDAVKLGSTESTARDLPSPHVSLSSQTLSGPGKPVERPQSLVGFSFEEILCLEADGLLSEKEREWLNKKPGKYFNRTFYAGPGGWMT